MVSIEKIYHFPPLNIKLILPDPALLQKTWEEKQLKDFPYWGKCWPSAIALSAFIAKTPSLIQDKIVLELAAGLALPSLVAANFAKKVITSDYLPEPLDFVNASIRENNISNIETRIINWQHIPDDLSADVLLLSDINYDPHAFEMLDQLLTYFLEKDTLIILSTPQRIMAKSFIDKWLSFQVIQEEFVDELGVRVTVFLLKKQ
ncbi:MAG: class I SAM-dependent methyltransferase [Sediminibacterium sp.]